MKNTITEIKNKLEGTSSRLYDAGEKISNLENRLVEFTQSEQQKEKNYQKTEDGLKNIIIISSILKFTL